MAQVNATNSKENSNYISNPIELTKKQNEEKKEQIIIDFNKKANLAKEKLENQRKVYSQVSKQTNTVKFQNWVLGNRAKSDLYKNDEKVKTNYELSNTSLHDARKNQDAELWRLQLYTDNYVSANKMTMYIG